MSDSGNRAQAERVIGYIDGFNLYFGMKAAGLKHLYWLNLERMLQNLLRPHQTLVATKYFTARVSFPSESVQRQGIYLEALSTIGNVDIIYGQYEGEPDVCDNCGATRIGHGEKMTDVNIAVEIAKDLYANRCDTVFLVTGDSDQTPTIRLAKDLFPAKRVVSVFPPARTSKRLQQNAHAFIHIKPPLLARSQLPDEVTKADGYVLRRPASWSR